MTALVTIQQFALLNQITMSSDMAGGPPCTANSYPINASYAQGSVPGEVAAPLFLSTGCQGLDFKEQGGCNETLLSAIITANVAGFYVFLAPWETISSMLININRFQGFNLSDRLYGLNSANLKGDTLRWVTLWIKEKHS